MGTARVSTPRLLAEVAASGNLQDQNDIRTLHYKDSAVSSGISVEQIGNCI